MIRDGWTGARPVDARVNKAERLKRTCASSGLGAGAGLALLGGGAAARLLLAVGVAAVGVDGDSDDSEHGCLGLRDEVVVQLGSVELAEDTLPQTLALLCFVCVCRCLSRITYQQLARQRSCQACSRFLGRDSDPRIFPHAPLRARQATYPYAAAARTWGSPGRAQAAGAVRGRRAQRHVLIDLRPISARTSPSPERLAGCCFCGVLARAPDPRCVS